ncbi:MAG: nitrilase-related carbon-nitrogen hydrolase [Ilumatobacteraceae bacterium]
MSAIVSRIVTVGGAQLGPIGRDDAREDVVERLLVLLRHGADRGCELVVFPELALTTFFPRWHSERVGEFDHYYETEMPSAATKPLFDEAQRLGVGFVLGYAELTPDGHRYNSYRIVERDGIDRRHVPQGAHPRARVERARPTVPAPRALLLRGIA